MVERKLKKKMMMKRQKTWKVRFILIISHNEFPFVEMVSVTNFCVFREFIRLVFLLKLFYY